MVVIIRESVCTDCNHNNICQILKKINKICTSYEKYADRIDIIINECSIKNRKDIRKRRKETKEKKKSNGWYMYYCEHCNSMHRTNSKIGILHKAMIDKR